MTASAKDVLKTLQLKNAEPKLQVQESTKMEEEVKGVDNVVLSNRITSSTQVSSILGAGELKESPSTIVSELLVVTEPTPQLPKTQQELLLEEIQRLRAELTIQQAATKHAQDQIKKLETMVRDSDIIVLKGSSPNFTVIVDGVRHQFVNYELRTTDRYIANAIKAQYANIVELPK